MLFGERLSLLRNERQMKQEDLGKIFHLSKSTGLSLILCKVENAM